MTRTDEVSLKYFLNSNVQRWKFFITSRQLCLSLSVRHPCTHVIQVQTFTGHKFGRLFIFVSVIIIFIIVLLCKNKKEV